MYNQNTPFVRIRTASDIELMIETEKHNNKVAFLRIKEDLKEANKLIDLYKTY